MIGNATVADVLNMNEPVSDGLNIYVLMPSRAKLLAILNFSIRLKQFSCGNNWSEENKDAFLELYTYMAKTVYPYP